MRERIGKVVLAASLIAACAVWAWLARSEHAPARMADAPATMLWAWERAEDLRFIEAKKVGVAFLAETILVNEAGVTRRPRMQPLRVAPGTWLMAVARIESSAGAGTKLSSDARSQIARVLAEMAELPGVRAVQVDYDARASEREFYRALLIDLRAALPADVPLSMTALASWCLGDNWIAGLPVDEAVPMLFQMGPETTAIRLHLKTGGDFSALVCRTSLGMSTNELLPQVPAGRRSYLWSPRPWTKPATELALGGGQP